MKLALQSTFFTTFTEMVSGGCYTLRADRYLHLDPSHSTAAVSRGGITQIDRQSRRESAFPAGGAAAGPQPEPCLALHDNRWLPGEAPLNCFMRPPFHSSLLNAFREHCCCNTK